MSEENNGKEEVVIKPLIKVKIRPIHNWYEWLELWQLATNHECLEWLESLLHTGFNGNVSFDKADYYEKPYDHIDRLIAYFTIADGWPKHYQFENSDGNDNSYFTGYDKSGNSVRKSTSELRQQVARKAFDMLCLNFFKEEEYRYEESESNFWWKVVLSEKLFPVIQNFFKIEKGRYNDRIEIRNLYHQTDKLSHNEQLAVDFLLKLANIIWGWKELETESWWKEDRKKAIEKYNMEKRTYMDAAKPWMIEILVQLDKLDILRKWMFKLDQPCLDKLREIALRSELDDFAHHVAKDRPVKTLEEACLAGSRAAWFLKEYELKKKELTRLKTVRDAELALEKAQRKVKQLAAK